MKKKAKENLLFWGLAFIVVGAYVLALMLVGNPYWG